MNALRTLTHRLWLGCVTGIAAGGVACSQTPPEDPVRTLERAERLATLCLQVNATDGSGDVLAEAIPTPEDACNAPDPNLERGTGAFYPYHYFALATGTLRGELAVIDMTIYQAADTDRSTPGVNFIPVGERPTDVVATPDSRWAFVTSAASQKPGLYAIPSNFIVDDRRTPGGGRVPKITDLVGCSLPAAPNGMAVVPNGGSGASPYDVVVLLPGDRLSPARLVAVDIASFADPREPDSAGLAAGTFEACPIKYEVAASLPPAPPEQADLEWSDGTFYAAGNALPADSYPLPGRCESDGADAGALDAGSGEADAGASVGLPPSPPRFGRSTQDGSTLYVADLDNPIIHVFDLGVTPPVELAPLEVISSADPTGTLSVRDIAVSPPTRELKRYLYAVEAAQGSLLVYDVTDKASSYRKPLVRPHAELQPFQPADRIQFSAAVNAVTFARHDVPLSGVGTVSGALCNPSQSEGYVESSSQATPVLGPKRLRGVFGFVALANGQIVVLDVDDWDAPCRRPANLSEEPRASSISEPQIAQPGDPYGVPLLASADEAARVSREGFFPISAPHRMRSAFMLRNENDSEGGDRIPKAPGGFTLSRGNSPLDTLGPNAELTPLLQPTAATFADPAGTVITTTNAAGATVRVPGVRFAFEVPDVHVDQDWAISYEGALPYFTGVRGRLSSDDDFATMVVESRETNFCALGVEDVSLSRDRASAFNDATRAANLEPDPLLEARVGDYLQITDELLPATDLYWGLDENDCWAALDGQIQAAGPSRAERGYARRDFCAATFGSPEEALTSRDFPVLEASESRLVVGRYQYPQGRENTVSERTVLGADRSNKALLAATKCCFHNQVQFNVRAGGTWLAFGSANQYLHHISTGEGGRCVQSCESRERLMNSRIYSLPREALDQPPPERSSVLAMRNPMFAYYMVDGRNEAGRVRPERDVVWRFQTRNQFAALSLTLASSEITTNPRAMRYLSPLGQVVLLDGAQQGLTLIDLRTMAFAASPVY